MSGHRRLPSEGAICTGCGIPLSDGYVLGCNHCSNRRQRRLSRGELFTETCFAGEMLDNRTGRIVASA
jgi:hypothetical protein